MGPPTALGTLETTNLPPTLALGCLDFPLPVPLGFTALFLPAK